MPDSRYVVKADVVPGLYLKDKIVYHSSRAIAAGFSDVYRGHFAGRSDAEVAIKRLRYTDEDEDANKKMDRALEKEITALMRIKHAHILSFVGLVERDGDPCIVTHWAANGTVRKYLKANPTADRGKIIREVATALAHLHSGKAFADELGTVVVHGDIHSNNVLIGADGSALLCDFGICKLIPPGQMASLTLKAPARDGLVVYIAPELHQGARRSVESDVFSFGMLMYVISGGDPFTIEPTPAELVGDLAKIEPTSTGVVGDPSKVEPPSPATIVLRLRAGKRPLPTIGMSKGLWTLVSDCWKGPPAERPTMKTVCTRLNVA